MWSGIGLRNPRQMAMGIVKRERKKRDGFCLCLVSFIEFQLLSLSENYSNLALCDSIHGSIKGKKSI